MPHGYNIYCSPGTALLDLDEGEKKEGKKYIEVFVMEH